MNLSTPSVLTSYHPGATALTIGARKRSRLLMRAFGTKEVFRRQLGGRLLEIRQFIPQGTQRAFPLFQPAILWSQRDWSHQALQAHWWELELSRERRFRFFARTP